MLSEHWSFPALVIFPGSARGARGDRRVERSADGLRPPAETRSRRVFTPLPRPPAPIMSKDKRPQREGCISAATLTTYFSSNIPSCGPGFFKP